MMGPNLTDEIDCGGFFNNIDDLLDFPTEDASHASASAAAPVDPPAKLWSADDSDLVFPGSTVLDLSAELSVPYEDIVQLEWLSNFVEDSFSSCGSLTMKKVEPSSNTTTKEDSTQFQTASPVSVLESSSFSSREKAPEIHIPVPCGRARSKRARPSTFNPHPILRLISSTFSVGENISKASLDCENFANFAESHPVNKLPKQPSGSRENKKKKKIKVSFPSGEEQNNTQSMPVRKCLHCEITKTPQWRAGPMGPKTLCNACGVRYKSGRLFPEYRPAASPTFCASLHSNSHKKVLEMRHKIGNIIGSATDSDALSELIPNTNSSITLEEYM